MDQNINNSHISVAVGTRPEIVKVAHIVRILGSRARLLHSGQHTDEELSGVFLSAAGLPAPETISGICGEPRHVQIGRMVEKFRRELCCATSMPHGRPRPGRHEFHGSGRGPGADSYTGIPVVHVVAGLRSYVRAMPEEINRCAIGVLADMHCAPTERAVANLAAEGVPPDRILLTGNTIVEATHDAMPDDQAARAIAADAERAEPGQYVLATIHRPENTDDPDRLRVILEELSKLGLPVLLPLHPSTRLAALRHGMSEVLDRLRVLAPADHTTFLGLARHTRLIVSDSGGVQEQCTVLKRPPIAVRNSTERPETIDAGFAHLVRPGPEISAIGQRLIGDEGSA